MDPKVKEKYEDLQTMIRNAIRGALGDYLLFGICVVFIYDKDGKIKIENCRVDEDVHLRLSEIEERRNDITKRIDRKV